MKSTVNILLGVLFLLTAFSCEEESIDNLQPKLTCEDCIAFFPFNGNADDESGNGYHGQVFGPKLAKDRFGNSESAYSFDGIDDYIAIAPSSLVDDKTSMSLSFWIQREGDAFYGLPIHTGNQGRFGVQVLTDSIKVNVVTNTTSNSTEYGTPFMPFNQAIWNHVVLRYDGTILQLIINTELIYEMEAEGNIWTPQSSYLAFGVYMLFGNPNHGYYEGILDDVRLYNYAITNQQIVDLSI